MFQIYIYFYVISQFITTILRDTTLGENSGIEKTKKNLTTRRRVILPRIIIDRIFSFQNEKICPPACPLWRVEGKQMISDCWE